MPTPDSSDERKVTVLATDQPVFRFSLRGLLVFVTIVSVCLAISVHFAVFVFVIATLGAIQVAILLFADWLIRPANRRALAIATAGTWATLGIGLFALALRALAEARDEANPKASVALAIGLTIGAGLCWLLATHRWRCLMKIPAAND